MKWTDVVQALPDVTADKLEVLEDAKPIASQSIDLDGDGKLDQLVFQSDFAPKQSKSFEIKTVAQPTTFPSKVFGRHVPERYDDFAWENDRVCFRVYGPGLEAVEPGSSGVDTWQKSTHRLVMNDWYKSAETSNDKMYYHKDHGEGYDGYKVGHGRGDGGDSIFIDGKEYNSGIRGWRSQKVIADGPVRLIFELGYEPFDAAGQKISETKRITLDAGSQLNHFVDTFTSDKPGESLTIGIGLMRHAQPGEAADHHEQGWVRYWDASDQIAKDEQGQPIDNGHTGTGVVIDSSQVEKVEIAKDHVWIFEPIKSRQPISFYAGSCWDRAEIKSVEAWDRYLADAAKRVALPLKITVGD